MAAAVVLAAVTVTFAVGLALTLSTVQSHRMLNSTAPVVIETGGPGGPPGAEAVPAPGRREPDPADLADPDEVRAVLRAEDGTGRFYGTVGAEVSASGVTGRTAVTGYVGDARWAAPRLVSGTWFTGPGEAVVTARFLKAAGIAVGDTVTLAEDGRSTTVRIVGEAFFTENNSMTVLTGAATLTALDLDTDRVRFYAEPAPGTSEAAYLSALTESLKDTGAYAHPNSEGSSSVIVAMNTLIDVHSAPVLALLALGGLVIAVAGAQAPAGWAARTDAARALRTE
ncbi:hypothetical protein [Streptomyces sp. NPDC088789]|uniref:hypothetical protein n=1 Tax=Streptomyces sp. NPDC088789 TaxID=3365899 RepID=UPI003805A8BF